MFKSVHDYPTSKLYVDVLLRATILFTIDPSSQKSSCQISSVKQYSRGTTGPSNPDGHILLLFMHYHFVIEYKLYHEN